MQFRNLDYISADPYNDAHVDIDIEKIPFADNSYDLVIAIAVLMHVLDDFAALREVIRVLKPGGKLLLWLGGLDRESTHEYYDRDKFDLMRVGDSTIPQDLQPGKLVEKDGLLFYNPRHMTRVYGKDIVGRLESLGLKVDVIHACAFIDSPSFYGINSNDKLVLCTKNDCYCSF